MALGGRGGIMTIYGCVPARSVASLKCARWSKLFTTVHAKMYLLLSIADSSARWLTKMTTVHVSGCQWSKQLATVHVSGCR